MKSAYESLPKAGGLDLRHLREIGTAQAVAKPPVLFAIAKMCAYIGVGLLCALAVYGFVRLPVFAGDTDVWYHLNGGRYIWTQQSIPRESFFSFVAPPKPWLNYYWLFQVIVFKLYALWDYYGLIALRASLYAVAIALIGWLLLRKQEKDEARLYLMLIFGLYVTFLIPRWTLVRPHMFSYTLTVAFLCLLESNIKSRLYLPFLGLLWMNLHGGAYPVMTLITLAYLVEIGVNWWREKSPLTSRALLGVVPIVLAMNTIYLTPHGWHLLEVPFTPLGPAARYINEFRPVQVEELLAFNISLGTLAPTQPTIFNVLLVVACAAVVASVVRRKVRISHLLLLAGGVVLLTKGARFGYEFVLLALPVIAANPLLPAGAVQSSKSKGIVALLAVVSLGMSISAVSHFFSNRPKYPMSPMNLPVGIVTFLNRVGSGGRVLNQPNAGGYVQWMLYPKYTIFMDMEVPFLFTDEDMYIASNMFGDRQLLSWVLERYKPDFITVGLQTPRFKQLIETFPEYVPVFFDDADVLYVNAKEHPEIAREFAVGKVDPFALIGSGVDGIFKQSDKTQLRAVLQKLLDVYPEGGIVNHMSALLDKEEGAFDSMLARAEVLIEHYPESSVGYGLKAQALSGQKLFRESVAWYRRALERLEGPGKLGIYRELGLVYKELGQYEAAYRLLRDSMNAFDSMTSYRDLYDFGQAAFEAGRTREAALIFRLGEKKVPPDDQEWEEKYQRYNALLRSYGGRAIQ